VLLQNDADSFFLAAYGGRARFSATTRRVAGADRLIGELTIERVPSKISSFFLAERGEERMPDVTPIGELILRVRAGDGESAEELVRDYEPVLRVAIRARLTDPTLTRLMDSGDVCQSVLASFFARAAAGQYDLNSPAQLVGLLTRMAHNKLASRARYLTRECRDVRRALTRGP